MHRTLSHTHDRAWGLPWVWERWTRRPRDENRLARNTTSIFGLRGRFWKKKQGETQGEKQGEQRKTCF